MADAAELDSDEHIVTGRLPPLDVVGADQARCIEGGQGGGGVRGHFGSRKTGCGRGRNAQDPAKQEQCDPMPDLQSTLKIVGFVVDEKNVHQIHLCFRGVLFVVVFSLAYVLGQNAQTKTQWNMQSRLYV